MSLNAAPIIQNQQLPAALTSLYTCPSARTVLIKHAVFCNTTGGAVTVTVEIVPNGGSSGNAAMLMDAISVAAGASYVSTELDGVVLQTGDSLYANASAAASISANIYGILQS